MTMVAEFGAPPAIEAMKRPRIRLYVWLSILAHALLLAWLFLDLDGIFGVPGPGGGDALKFQLAAGQGQDIDAAADIDSRMANDPRFADAEINEYVEPKPEPEPPKPDPVVEKVPDPPKPAPQPVRRKAEPSEPVEKKPTTQQRGSAETAVAGGSVGTVGNDARGSGGDAEETIINKQGTSLSGGQIRGQMSGQTLYLEMGRLDIRGGNRLTDLVIELNADGTSRVKLTYFYHKTFHKEYSSTKSFTGRGKWWIEGNRWCHQSKIIHYGTKDCYDMTAEGGLLRLYYGRCKVGSSPHCKTGRIAAEGAVR